MCTVGYDPSGVLIHAHVATQIGEFDTGTARLITNTLFNVRLHISAELVASFSNTKYFLTFFSFSLICVIHF